MAANQILPFALGTGANVLSFADYEALAALSGGFVAGVAKSVEFNTVLRQSSFIAAMIAQFTANQSGADVNDDGNSANLLTNFQAALTNFLSSDITPAYSITAIPTTKVANAILVIEAGEIWPWVTTAYYTGYRSVNVGSPVASAYTSPREFEVDAVGGTLSKTTYARLWAYAQENGLVVASGSWVAGSLNFVDLGSGNFQAPDLRNMFIRLAAGATDPDTANARGLGTYKADTMQGHWHRNWSNPSKPYQSGSVSGDYLSTGQAGTEFSAIGDAKADATHGTPRVGMETAPKNTALYSRIHI